MALLSQHLQIILKNIPDTPGVYKFFNEKREVLYVGKAKSLLHRVRSYFIQQNQTALRTQKLVENIRDIQYIEVGSELEAFILETNLIKELRPRFNVLMKDDKNYVYIKITANEDFPRISIVRKVEKDGAHYFGPKTAAYKAKTVLKFLKKIFPYRHCNLDIDFVPHENGQFGVKVRKKTMKYPCLDYHTGRCVGPCVAQCAKEEYAAIIRKIIDFLQGKENKLKEDLQQEMLKAAVEKKFELAARLRDKLQMLDEVLERQRVSDPLAGNQDVIHYVERGGKLYFNLFMIREGKLINQENFILKSQEYESFLNENTMKKSEAFAAESLYSQSKKRFSEVILESFLQQYYEKAADFPDEVLLPHSIENFSVIEEWMTFLRSKKVRLIIPKIGKKSRLLDLAAQNAESFAHQSQAQFEHDQNRTTRALASLAKFLHIPHEIHRIEGYDISHFGGTEIVGSMVVFDDGMPKKSHYRRFRIKVAPKKIDDYLDMKEVLGRRLRKINMKNRMATVIEGVVFEKAKKIDLNYLVEIILREKLDAEALDVRDCIVARKKKSRGKKTEQKEIIGFGRVKALNEEKKEAELASLWVKPEERGKHIGQELVIRLLKNSAKHSWKKIYAVAPSNLEDYYAALGFHSIEIVPPSLQQKMERCRSSIGCQISSTLRRPKFFPLQNDEGLGQISEMEVIAMAYRPQKMKEDVSFRQKPDLLLIDGGKGQLNVVLKILREYRLDIPIISLAKRDEEIFIPDQSEPLRLSKNAPELHVLQRVRDEAHRFAHAYQIERRNKRLFV
ncbi:GNAT family N-acetyltransferase [Candidatus Peregrinibacteria bacterium]|nr:GNAT family N-acetyltransferase [Candidatus Peregrinibacteria bacterium]